MTGINVQNVNSYNNYPQLQQDVQQVKGVVSKVDSADKTIGDIVFGAITPLRRTASLNDKIQNNDLIGAVGLASLAAVNLPEDWRDLKSAGSEVRSWIDNTHIHKSAYNRRTHQHDFSFFRGTFLERFVDPEKAKNKKLAEKLLEADKTVADTKFGKFIQNKLGVVETNLVETTIDDIGKKGKLYASTFKGGNAFGRLSARALKRMSLLGVAALALIELPKIFKSQKKGNGVFEKTGEMTKQTAKSAVNVASISAGIAYGGAIGSKAGVFGSLLGMGAGAFLGATASRKAQAMVG